MNLHQFGARHTNGGPRLFLGVVVRISYLVYRISCRQESGDRIRETGDGSSGQERK
jgi:hypothetical protein